MQTQISSHVRSGFSSSHAGPFFGKYVAKANGEPSLKMNGSKVSVELATLDKISLSKFRVAARHFLIKDEKNIGQIVEKARRFANEPGGNQLEQTLRHIENELPSLPSHEKVPFLFRALRRAGRTTKLVLPPKKKGFRKY